ncbi:uncharacterized protein LOC129601487 [Paramacrobiotus metropolitanus]|uniref:uncharacterized protein LOC129601487 n=1 Tax=Paramacrobiotus metropolitanus TaxID=2943436 RepID=UPI002445F8D0|nr:uncharacterized protein LOC129601487 [Paramacrobiotus metropolitanus]
MAVTKYVVLLWTVTVIQLSGCCSPSQTERLNEILEEGLRQQRQDDLVILPFDRGWGGASEPWPVYNQAGLERPHLGDHVTFTCQLPHGKDGHEVSWRHHNRVVFERGQPVGPVEDGHEYSFSQQDNVLLFRIHNVSFLARGEVTCRDTVTGIPLQRYRLLPLVTRANQVFATPLPSQRLTAGATLTISCALRRPLSPEVIQNDFPLNHVMVRHNGRLVSTRPAEALYSLPPFEPPSPEDVEAFTAARFLNRPGFDKRIFVDKHIPNITALTGNGPAECWYRPHVGLHEWIVQRALIVVQ